MFGLFSDSFAWGLFSRRVCGGKIGAFVAVNCGTLSVSLL